MSRRARNTDRPWRPPGFITHDAFPLSSFDKPQPRLHDALAFWRWPSPRLRYIDPCGRFLQSSGL